MSRFFYLSVYLLCIKNVVYLRYLGYSVVNYQIYVPCRNSKKPHSKSPCFKEPAWMILYIH